MDRLADRFDVASPLLSLQSGSKAWFYGSKAYQKKEEKISQSVRWKH